MNCAAGGVTREGSFDPDHQICRLRRTACRGWVPKQCTSRKVSIASPANTGCMLMVSRPVASNRSIKTFAMMTSTIEFNFEPLVGCGSLSSSLSVRAAINGQRRSGNVLSFRTRKECHDVRDILHRTVSAERGD
jgi:hypothetical protein